MESVRLDDQWIWTVSTMTKLFWVIIVDMSGRPRRNTKPIQRLQNQQAANAAKSRTAVRSQKVTRNINNVNLQPKRKLKSNAAQARVLTILDSIAEGKNEKIYNMLYSIYRDASSTLFTRANVFDLDDTKLVEVLEAQYAVMTKNVRSRTGGKPNTLSLKLDGENKLDFCLLVWLDMSHDGTINTNFQDFIKSDIVKILVGSPPQYTNDTQLMKRMKALNIIIDPKIKRVKLNKPVNGRKTKNVVVPGLWPGSDFERIIKDNLPFLFDIQAPLKTIAGKGGLSNLAINKEKQPIYVAIDSESEYKSLSQLVDNSKYLFNGRNGKIQRYFLKPIITLSNRVDPGRLMPTKGVTEEFAKLMQNVNTLKSTQLYNVTNCNFKLGSTSLTLRTLGKGRFDLKIGKRSIPYGITAGEAKRTVNTNEKLSKFLGDFMQVLTVASKPVSQRMVLGTLDGVMCGMCCFISKNLMNEEPRLFIDMSFKQQNQILMYGVSDLLKASGPVQQTRSNIGSNITRAMEALNTSREVTSGSNRIEGGDNTNNKNNRGIFGRIFGGTKKPANNRNANKMNVNNTTSVAGSSSGSVSRNNNNNNNVSSNNRRGVKRGRNNNNNVSQPNAKRVNTTRNRLIQNLKKKNLPNFVVNGLMRSYDNKRKTANQIIREANNFGKTFAMGKTAQRKSTLRPR
jgi:hypothetical protein